MSFTGSDGTVFPNSIESELEFMIKTTEFRHSRGVAEECLRKLAELEAQRKDNRLFVEHATLVQGDLRKELEALKACEDCTRQEIEIKALRGQQFDENDPRFRKFFNNDPHFHLMIKEGMSVVDMVYMMAELRAESKKAYLDIATNCTCQIKPIIIDNNNHTPDAGKMAANKGRL